MGKKGVKKRHAGLQKTWIEKGSNDMGFMMTKTKRRKA